MDIGLPRRVIVVEPEPVTETAPPEAEPASEPVPTRRPEPVPAHR